MGAGAQARGAGAQQLGAGAQLRGAGAQQLGAGAGAQQDGAAVQQPLLRFFLKQSNRPASAVAEPAVTTINAAA